MYNKCTLIKCLEIKKPYYSFFMLDLKIQITYEY